MAIVRSFGKLQATARATPGSSVAVASTSHNTGAWSWPYNDAYAAIYATQPSVRTCVDFLARNIAQLGLHIFRRVDDTDRLRLDDHELAQWLDNPNPSTTSYRLIESLVADLALYFNAFWLKVRIEDPAPRIGLVRIPPGQMCVEGGLLPTQFVWTVQGEEVPLSPSEVVYFNGYNAIDPIAGLSPVETLRRTLQEDMAATEYRANYWRNASRIEGVIERPREAPKWTPEQKQSWREQWRARYTGAVNAGGIPVLEDGMTFRPTGFSARDSEYSAARKLGREECASLWHIPLPMVGILDHATFSNIKEQHKQLYADCLGPWNRMIEQQILLQLLPECRDRANIYLEFNIAEKLKGSFEEQAQALRLLVGRPVMTANEGRARLNLPRITDDSSADELAAQQGGPADAAFGGIAPDPQARTSMVVRAHLQRHASRLAKFSAEERAEALNVGRCINELTADLDPILGHHAALDAAVRVTDHTYSLLLEGRDPFAAVEERYA